MVQNLWYSAALTNFCTSITVSYVAYSNQQKYPLSPGRGVQFPALPPTLSFSSTFSLYKTPTQQHRLLPSQREMLTDRRIKHPRLTEKNTSAKKSLNPLKQDIYDASPSLQPNRNLVQTFHEASSDDSETHTVSSTSSSSSKEPPRHTPSPDVSHSTPELVEPTAVSDDLPADDDHEKRASDQERTQETSVSSQESVAPVTSDDPVVPETPSFGTTSLPSPTEHVDNLPTDESSNDRPKSTPATDPEASTENQNALDETDKKPTVKPYSLKTATTHKVNFAARSRFKYHEFPSRSHDGGGALGSVRPSGGKYGFFSSNKYSSGASGPPVVPRAPPLRRNVSFPNPAITSAVMNQNVDAAVVKTANGDVHVTDPLPLNNTWSFRYSAPKDNERSESQSDWEMDIQTIVDKINTVQQFCRMWNFSSELREPFRLPCGSNMFFFKSDVMPAWEDPHNVGGGRLTIVPDGRDLNVANLWRDILLDMVGATLPHAEAICGVVFNHKDTDRFDIWLTRAAFNRKSLSAVGEEICSKLQKNFSPLRVYHKSHPRQ